MNILLQVAAGFLVGVAIGAVFAFLEDLFRLLFVSPRKDIIFRVKEEE